MTDKERLELTIMQKNFEHCARLSSLGLPNRPQFSDVFSPDNFDLLVEKYKIQDDIAHNRYSVLFDYTDIVKQCFNNAPIRRQPEKVFYLSLKDATYKVYGKAHGSIIYKTLFVPAFKNNKERKRWVKLQSHQIYKVHNHSELLMQYKILYDALNEFIVSHGFQPLNWNYSLPATEQSGVFDVLNRLYRLGADIDDNQRVIVFKKRSRFNACADYKDFLQYCSYIFYGYDDSIRYLATIRYLKTIYSSPAVRHQIEEAEAILRYGKSRDKLDFLQNKGISVYASDYLPGYLDDQLNAYVVKLLDKSPRHNPDGYLYIQYLTGQY